MQEITFGDQEFSIGLTGVDGPAPSTFGRLFYIINGHRHEVESYGEPLGGYYLALDDALDVLRAEGSVLRGMSRAEAAVVVNLLYECKYGFTEAAAKTLCQWMGHSPENVDSTFLLDRSFEVTFLPDAGGGDCTALVKLPDRVEVVGLSYKLGLLQVSVDRAELIILLQKLLKWTSERC